MSKDTTKRKGICVVGSANVDLTFRTPRLPVPGETLAGRSLHQCMGGKGANQAVVAARLGADVAFVARVGNDGFGTDAIEAYKAEGINTSFMQQDDEQPTGTAAILVDEDAENCIIVVAGANQRLTPDDVRTASSVIKQSDLVLCQLETPVETAVEAFRLARDANKVTVLTPAPAKNITSELLALCDVCVPNKTEISAMVDQPVSAEADAIRAAQLLRGRGVDRVALTMGGEGVLVLDETGPTYIAATKVEAVDTTGAGDAVTAALAVSLADGLGLVDAARFAREVAAISVTRIGTQTSFPSLEEVNNWNRRKENE